MLRDGRFIKEEPPKIGAHYTPKAGNPPTPEERLVQDILLNGRNERQSFLSRMFGVMLRV
jgi:hypothetical protein